MTTLPFSALLDSSLRPVNAEHFQARTVHIYVTVLQAVLDGWPGEASRDLPLLGDARQGWQFRLTTDDCADWWDGFIDWRNRLPAEWRERLDAERVAEA